MIKIWYLNIHDITEDAFTQQLSRVPKGLRNEVTRFHFLKDQKFRLFGKLIVEQFHLSHSMAFHWSRWQLSKYGKPFLTGGLNFNISHSGDYVCVAFSNKDVGIDLEQITPIDLDSVLQYLHEDEREYISEAKIPNEAFFKVWTRKEAFLKAKGCGLVQNMNSKNCLNNVIENGVKWFIESLDNVPDYKMAISTEIGTHNFEVTRMTGSSFM